MGFQLVPKSVTLKFLNDLERCTGRYFAEGIRCQSQLRQLL